MKGVFATQDIKKGETIFLEDITVFESLDTAEDAHVPVSVRLAFRIQANEHLGPLIKDGFNPKLWKAKPPKEHKVWLQKAIASKAIAKKSLMDAYNITCAYNISLAYNQGISGNRSIHVYKRAIISPVFCRVNNSCEPNSKIWTTTDPDIVRQRLAGLVANSDIKKGEEITFFYLEHVPDELTYDMHEDLKRKLQPQYWDVKARRREIKKQYKFLCQCSRCKSESGM